MISSPGTFLSLRCHSWVLGNTCDDQLRLAQKSAILAEVIWLEVRRLPEAGG